MPTPERSITIYAQTAVARRAKPVIRKALYRDTAEDGRFIETFLVGSWLEHLCQHERVTKDGRAVQDAVSRFSTPTESEVSDFVALYPDEKLARL